MKSKWVDLQGAERLEAFVEHVDNICTIPESVQQVMSLTRDRDAKIIPVVNAIMKDPVLATELLRLVNSPFYGQAKQVVDIRRAVIILGMQELHNLAAAVSMLSTFGSPNELFAEFRALSVLSAALARILSKEFGGLDESQAFLSGLLSQIGAMACVAVDGDEYEKIWEASSHTNDRRATLEMARYGARNEEIGKRVLSNKDLPTEVADAVGATVFDASNEMERVVVFSREVAPAIVVAAREKDRALMENAVAILARDLKIEGIENDRLFELCLEAASTAELGLQGELDFVEESDEPDAEEISKTQQNSDDETDAPPDDQPPPAPTQVRVAAKPKSKNTAAIVIAVVVSLAALSMIAYFVLR